jgi:hypothetical protein
MNLTRNPKVKIKHYTNNFSKKGGLFGVKTPGLRKPQGTMPPANKKQRRLECCFGDFGRRSETRFYCHA